MQEEKKGKKGKAKQKEKLRISKANKGANDMHISNQGEYRYHSNVQRV